MLRIVSGMLFPILKSCGHIELQVRESKGPRGAVASGMECDPSRMAA
jgi:hypothetical protein